MKIYGSLPLLPLHIPSSTLHQISANRVSYAKKAVKKQGAEVLLFEFEKMNVEMMKELMKLKEIDINVKYYLTNDKNHVIDR
jgi:hypothetical protein